MSIPFLKKFSMIYTLIEKLRLKLNKEENKALFNPYALATVYSSDMSNWSMDSYYLTADEYISYLKFLIVSLKKDEPIHSFQIPQQMRRVYVADFFTHKNAFIDPVYKAGELLTVITELFELATTLERSDERPSYAMRNLRYVSAVLNNLRSITEVFNESDQTVRR